MSRCVRLCGLLAALVLLAGWFNPPASRQDQDPTASAAPPEKPESVFLPILVYHVVRPGPPPSTPMAALLTVTPDQFEEQMKYLKAGGYDSVSFAALHDYLDGRGDLPYQPVIISFDDGWENQYRFAYPILKKYGFSATFFVVTNYIDHENFLTTEQLREMIANGMRVGSHSRSHPRLDALGDDALWNEVRGSKEYLEERLGQPVDDFAYPYGGYNQRVVQFVAAAGYKTARTVDFGITQTLATIERLNAVTFSGFVNNFAKAAEATN